MGLHQTKKFLHNKGNHQQNEKTTYWMGEQFANTSQGLISKIYTELIQPNTKKNRQSNLKMGKGPEYTVLQKDIQMANR